MPVTAAVECPGIPDVPEHSTDRIRWDPGTVVRCDDPEFSGKCEAGYTGGTVSEGNREAHITCAADGAAPGHGKYTGSLTCLPVPCSLPMLPPPAARSPGGGCPDGSSSCNVVIPDECSSMHYSEKCSIGCADGYYSALTTQDFVCEKANDKTGDAAPDRGIWSPPEDTLRCEAVYCDAADLPRGGNTFDPLIDELKDYTSRPTALHALDLAQLGAAPDHQSKCSAHYKGVGDAMGGETPAADGTCLTACLPSWYPITGNIEQQLTFT